ncbi:hypothetical protein ON010_g4353 [Phytophthora cinnamomi]|nr:hypothetical protein ON010_g4353 [Phytophthora cinnamomi]
MNIVNTSALNLQLLDHHKAAVQNVTNNAERDDQSAFAAISACGHLLLSGIHLRNREGKDLQRVLHVAQLAVLVVTVVHGALTKSHESQVKATTLHVANQRQTIDNNTALYQ